jgi:nucleotide-binding universal stress UspA family protein
MLIPLGGSLIMDTIQQLVTQKVWTAKRLRNRKFWRCLERIFVVTDLSDDSMKAIAFGTRLSKRFHSKLTLVYIYEIPRSLQFMRGQHTMKVMEKDFERAHERFDQLCRCVRARYGNFEKYFRVGNAHDEIVWAADALNADLLIISAEDRNEANDGSCAKRILRDARCPVLLVHKDDRCLGDRFS